MDVIRRAIERIDEPDEIVIAHVELRRFLFAEKQMVRITGCNYRTNRSLRRQIGIGHQVGRRLFPRSKSPAPRKQFARAGARGHFTGLNKFVHQESSLLGLGDSAIYAEFSAEKRGVFASDATPAFRRNFGPDKD